MRLQEFSGSVNEVQILSKVKGKGSDLSDIPLGGKPIPKGEESHYLGREVGDINGLQVWRDQFGSQISYHLVDPRRRSVLLTVFGSRYPGNARSLIVSGVYAVPGNPVRAADFYHHLIRDQGLTLVSDRKQSPGGQRVWQQLEDFNDIEIYGYDTRTGKTLNISASDEEMYAVPAGAAQDRETRDIARNIRLVATAR